MAAESVIAWFLLNALPSKISEETLLSKQKFMHPES